MRTACGSLGTTPACASSVLAVSSAAGSSQPALEALALGADPGSAFGLSCSLVGFSNGLGVSLSLTLYLLGSGVKPASCSRTQPRNLMQLFSQSQTQ